MPKFVISSDDLPLHLPDAVRFSAWCLQFASTIATAEFTRLQDVPFQGLVSVVPIGNVGIIDFQGSITGLRRTKAAALSDSKDNPVAVINLGRHSFQVHQNGREVELQGGGATIFSEAEAGIMVSRAYSRSVCVRIPRHALAASIGTPEDHMARSIDTASEPFRMLVTYLNTLLANGGLSDPITAQSVGSHVIDLVALALGPCRNSGEIAERGLRAGRLNAVLAEIDAGFADPAFSAEAAARRLKMSVRYLYYLLQETGTGLGERVLELRLQNARRLLAQPHHGHRKITDIALSSGFTDISHFNRTFRARFGMTPSDIRAMVLDPA